MKEAEMEHFAGLIAAVVLRHQDARAEVNRFREQFQDVHYSFDNARNDAPAVAEA
jgi:hypothetical protein